MPKVRNFAEREFHFPGVTTPESPGGAAAGLTVFPRMGMRQDAATGNVTEVPGEIDVDQSVIDRIMKHHAAKSWFGPDQRGRPQLQLASAAPAPAAEPAPDKKPAGK